MGTDAGINGTPVKEVIIVKGLDEESQRDVLHLLGSQGDFNLVESIQDVLDDGIIEALELKIGEI